MKRPNLYNVVNKALKITGIRVTPSYVRPQPIVANQMSVDHIHQIIDEAVAGNCSRMFALYRDIVLQHGHIQTELNKRKLAVLGDPLRINPMDDSPEQALTVQRLKDSTKKAANLDLSAPVHLLDSALYPVAVCEKVFKRSTKPGLRYELAEVIPVSHELLDFSTGELMIKEVNEMGHATGKLYRPDPARHIIHRGHLLNAPDNFGGPFRALVFWWLLSTQGRGWWSRYLERYGSGFLVGRYDQDDDDSRRILEGAFQYATTVGGLVVTRDTEIEIHEANTSGSGDAHEKFITVCNREISKIILGQTLSAEAQSTGLGSGVSKAHERVRSDYRDFDALMLANCLKRQVFDQLADINGLDQDHYQVFYGDVDTDEAEISGALVRSLSDAGLRLTDSGIALINRRTGLEFERDAAPDTPRPLSRSAVTTLRAESKLIEEQSTAETIVDKASADYRRHRRARYAQAARIIRDAATPEEAIATLTAEMSVPHSAAIALVADTMRAAHLTALDAD
jgi:phage gp29-like protein